MPRLEKKEAMNSSRYASSQSNLKQFIWVAKEVAVDMTANLQPTAPTVKFMPLQPIRQWLDTIEVRSAVAAHRFCQLIPARCPFERTVKLGSHTLFQIPPLCKLNPFYEQIVGLRFRALCYLADECGEDVSRYC